MNTGPTNLRMQGVRKTTPGVRDEGAPRTVRGVEPCEYFAVAFNDEQGILRRAVVLRVGGQVYIPPGAIEWAGSLKPAAGWLAEEINRMAGQPVAQGLDPSQLPPDQVDLMGGELDQQGQGSQVPGQEGEPGDEGQA